ncbi:MAG: aminotransferase class I/II-fold pyridoxal phosphate-dependent enzyme [Candidatus Brocadiae bacterium]|nr:aminotransferase class I/II-fold pyridoxal phosphate-dependent enzyme [Candidatus Brocadiia bacterium]
MNETDPLTPYGNRPMVTPIVSAVNYEYLSFEVLRRITDGEIDGYTYHRDDNPTCRVVEKQIAALEGAVDCVICTSGMAAITMVFLTYLKGGDQLLTFHDIYGANYKVALILEKFGVEVVWLDAAEQQKVADNVKDNTRMIFCETPTNPLVKTVDMTMLREQADRVGAMLVVDNTFATPYHQLPLEFGADLVVHSATKGLGGHNDLMAGAIACPTKEYYDELWFTRQAIGTTLDPFPASRLEKGLKTLNLRAAKMAENAQGIAEFLATRPKVPRVCYPGLPSDPGHEIARRQMKNGFGGVLAFDVGETQEDAKRFVEKLEVIYHAVSLGAPETLVCLPVLTTMLYLPPERRTTFGVKPNTVRLSAGLEDLDELIEDLKQALE